MFERCGDRTRLRRFFAVVSALPEPYLTDALSGRCGHLALVAVAPAGIVALASRITVGHGVAEIGLLVEDAHQRRGIGTCLLARIVTAARDHDIHTLLAHVQAEQRWLVPLLAAYGECEATIELDVLEVTVRNLTAGRHT
jgi:GNAT superfamily N-acetyltransferase